VVQNAGGCNARDAQHAILADVRFWLIPAAALPYACGLMMREPPASPVVSATILLVEDNDIYRQVVCAALQKRFPNWEILPADNLAAAAKFIGSQPLDVVVTDLSLPDGSGTDLLPSLATHLKNGLKLVALTNDSPQDVLKGLKQRGYHGFVAKEHGIKALCDVVQAVLDGKEVVSKPPQT
jgi:DNA-binding NarL/FixJ family response regulator